MEVKKQLIRFIIPCCLLVLLAACGRIEGEFAIKKFPQESYHRVDRITEVSAGESVDWTYVARNIKGNHTIGVALVKKELVWVDVNVRNETLNESQKIIYGKIENLEKGNYKILIAENGEKIAEMEFIVYEDSSEMEFDEDQ